MSLIFTVPKQIALTNGERPYAGALAYFFETGTSTPADVYTTSARSVAHAHPVVADAAGVFATIYLDPADDLDVTLRQSDGTLIYTQAHIVEALTAADIGSILYDRTTAETSAGVTPTNYQYEPGHLYRYGTNTTQGTTDLDSALTDALSCNDAVFIPTDTVLLGSTVSVPDDKGIYGDGIGSILKKGANGAVLSLGEHSWVMDLKIDGNSASFTGVGITIPFTAEFEGFQRISNIQFRDTASYNVQYISGAAGAGFGSSIESCDLQVASDAVSCIQWGNDPTNTHGNRRVANCIASSGSLLDINNADNGFIIGNTIGDGGGLAGLIWGSTSAKVICEGNRIAASATMTVQGSAHTITGNVIASAVTFASGTTSCHFTGNETAGVITDSSGQSNQIDMPITSYATTWTASTPPAIGDGTIYSTYIREGRVYTVQIGVLMGSTTTYGSGEWSFSAPRAASGSTNFVGTWFAKDATGNYAAGAARLDAGGATITLIPDGAATTVKDDTPFTWADTDFLRLQISYSV